MLGMVVKQSRKEVEWRQRLARFAACSQPIKPFCKAELVSEATFYRWRKQLAETGDATPAVGFVDVGVMSSAPEAQSMTQDQLASAALEVRLDLGHGVVLHIVRR
jgi:transposase-like protein